MWSLGGVRFRGIRSSRVTKWISQKKKEEEENRRMVTEIQCYAKQSFVRQI